jgi:hypothetical protein
MSNTVRTPIVDKNGKPTHVNKKADAHATSSRVAAVSPTVSAYEEPVTLRPSGLTYEEIVAQFSDFVPTHKWKRDIEHKTNDGVISLLNYTRKEGISTDTPIAPSGKTFTELRSHFDGLHFAKEMLSNDERTMLTWAESLIHKIDSEAPGGYAH